MKWIELINTEEDYTRDKKALRQILYNNLPEFAELIANSACMFQCQHCIYPKSFAIHNSVLNKEQRDQLVDKLISMQFSKYVLGGRTTNTISIDYIEKIKSRDKDAKIGAIVDGPQGLRLIDKILDTKVDWLDISVDGNEYAHDTQRNSSGNYQDTVQIIKKILKKNNGPKLSVLSAVTTINIDTIEDMILNLYEIGVRDFHIHPINRSNAVHISKDLVPSYEKFTSLINRLEALSKKLDLVAIIVPFYELNFAKHYLLDNKHLNSFQISSVDNTIHKTLEHENGSIFRVKIIPSSLGFCDEFVINSDGRVITPKCMKYGNIPKKYVLGSYEELLNLEEGEFTNFISEKKAFDFYIEELNEERKLFKNILMINNNDSKK